MKRLLIFFSFIAFALTLSSCPEKKKVPPPTQPNPPQVTFDYDTAVS